MLHASVLVTAAVAAALLLGGLVKGTLGLGLPVFVISVLGAFMEPRAIIGLLLIPVVASNLWQGFSTEHPVLPLLRRFWPLIVAFSVGTYVGTRLLRDVPTHFLLLLLGFIVLGFCVTSWLKPTLHLPPSWESWFGPGVGTFAGVLNGVSMVNGPPLVMYLISLRLDRERFIGAYGLIAVCGSIPLAASLLGLGVVRPPQLIGSALALIPVFSGLLLGRHLRRRIESERFRRVLLIALAVLGANLLRRGLS